MKSEISDMHVSKKKKFYYSAPLLVIAVGVVTYFFYQNLTVADPQKVIGIISMTVLPASAFATEYVDIKYFGSGKVDLSDWRIVTSSSTVYQFESVKIADKNSVRICRRAHASLKCNMEWGSGVKLNDEIGSIGLVNSEGKKIVSLGYTATNSTTGVTATAQLEENVLLEDDVMMVCHSENGKEYSKTKDKVGVIIAKNAHATHEKYDVIPPFYYANENDVEYFEGLNWVKGKESYKAGCR